MMRLKPRKLDLYVMSEFWKIFFPMAIGFPLLVIVFDLTDHLDRYLAREIPPLQIALSYVYWIPDSMFMVLPAAVLFATVFSIGTLTRYAEITAAKASGVSFHRLAAPIFVAAGMVMIFALFLGELIPITNERRNDLLQGARRGGGGESTRLNFAYAAEGGRVYKVSLLDVQRGVMERIEVERRGKLPDFSTVVLTAASAEHDERHGWTLRRGVVHVLPDTATDLAFAYDSLYHQQMREQPRELLASPRSPQEMRYAELGRFIAAMERSGGNVNKLKVEQALKLAIPVTCIIIAIFGAPLATSTQRGGTAWGVGVSLAVTVVFLMMIQLTKAIGEGGIIDPIVAAWIPNALFGASGLFLLARARS